MEPFLGEIRLVSFNYPMRGWAFCNGQLLPINQNTALFSLLGTMYGGNGVTTFALPDMRGRMPVHSPDAQGTTGGAETASVGLAEMPAHSHQLMASDNNTHAISPAGRAFGSVEQNGLNMFRPLDGSAALHPSTLTQSGGSQPHNNMQPYAVSHFQIALVGIFPSRN
jgi:microcystin-dependent protein